MARKNKTHKKRSSRSSSSSLTIPELRKSFNAVEGYLAKHLRGGSNSEELVGGFRKEWRKHFRRDLSAPAARSYINHMKKRKGYNHTGGSSSSSGSSSNQLTGAPLDYDTRAGVYGPNGNYLNYVSKGFQAVTPEPGTSYAQAGGKRSRKNRKTRKNNNRNNNSNQKGGLNPLTGAPYAAQFRPFVAESPQTLQHSAQSAWKGLPPAASSDPSNPSFAYKMSPGWSHSSVANIDVAGLDRDLLQDVKVPY